MNPTKYREEYCAKLIAHMQTGMSYESFGAEVNVGLSTMYDWESRHPEWKEAKEVSMLKAQSYFEKRLVAKASGNKMKNDNFDVKLVDNSCLIFALKTRFHKTYGEKQELSIGGKDGGKEIKLSYSLDDNAAD